MKRLSKILRRAIPALALIAGTSMLSYASLLTPEEALSRALGSSSMMMKAPAKVHKLAYTEYTNDNATVYIFSADDSTGFLAVSASDAVTPVLGYSDGAKFDADNIPPAMKWLLSEYSRQIEWAESNNVTFAAAPAADRVAISPMVTTLWDQDAPFNNACPYVVIGRGVTGCAATAMAQIMKYHEWPRRGIGSKNYSYDVTDGTYKYTINVSADFSSVEYDWANMLDSYGWAYTQRQAKAVADLMFHAGAAIYTVYIPDGSGAYADYFANGMYTHFNYDKGIKSANRVAYTAHEWDNMIYNEMLNGRPVLYSGATSKNEGHAFVCDGYNTDGTYHINWGWSGYANGYFVLSTLNPEYSGIGGGTAGLGFAYAQNAIVGIQPPTGDEPEPYFEMWGIFNATQSFFGKNNLVVFSFSDSTTDGGCYNMSCYDMNATLGSYIVDSENNRQYVELSQSEMFFNSYDGISFFLAGEAYKYPNGTYLVYPGFKSGSHYNKMKWDSEKNTPLLFNVTNTGIEVKSTRVNNDVAAIPLAVRTADGEKVTLKDFLAGNTYKVSTQIKCKTLGDLVTRLEIRGADNKLIATSDNHYINVENPDFNYAEWNITFPANAATDQDARLYVYYQKDAGWATNSGLQTGAGVTANALNPEPGDVNGDGEYTISDLMLAQAFALDETPANGRLSAADVNNDGEVTVTDLAIIISRIFRQNSYAMRLAAASSQNFAEAAELAFGTFSVSNATEYCGAQFDLYLANGAEMPEIKAIDDNFTVKTSRIADNVVRVIVYSHDNSNFATGDICYIDSRSDVFAGNIILSKKTERGYQDFVAAAPDTETAIAQISAAEQCEAFDLAGNKLYEGAFAGFRIPRGVTIVKTASRTIPVIR